MLRQLSSAADYMDFVREMCRDPDFSDPMLTGEEQIRRNLLDAPKDGACQIWGAFEGAELAGLFVFLILEEEAYIEMLVGLSRVRRAYEEMLGHLKAHYRGYEADFVFNPGNRLLRELLEDEQAEFEAEQQKLVLKRDVSFRSGRRIELYSAPYREQYLSMHRDEGRYWTADRVIAAPSRFRILLAIEGGEAVGYMDVSCAGEENEPYDLFVREEHRGMGYAKALLARAIACNRPKGMTALVDAGDRAAIGLYEALGFDCSEGENSVTAHMLL